MPANTSTIQIEVQIDGKGGIKVLRQIGDESNRTGKKGGKSFREMDRSAGAFGARLTSVHGLLLKLGIGYAIIRTAREMMELTDTASDLNETISKSRAIFGEVSSEIEAWAAKSAVAIGLSTQEALEHTATLGNMYQQLGAGIDIAEQSSRQMVKLAADLASFHNVAGGASEVLLAMQSAFRGEYDALQRYIPTINAAAVQEQALAMTHKFSAKELTNLEKALAAQAIIMQDAGAAVGDFGRTSGELANQKRILAAQIENVKAKLGEHLIPAVTQAYREMDKFMESLDEEDMRLAADAIQNISSALISAARAAAQYSAAWVQTYQALGLASSGAISYKEALTDASAALERFNRGLSERAKLFSIGPGTKGYEIYNPPQTTMPKTTGAAPDLKALKEALKLEKQLWEYEVKAAQRADEEIIDAHEAMIEYEKTLYEEAAKNKIGMTAKMYSDLKFSSDDYYAYQINQLQRQADDYESFTGNAALAHMWLTEQIKALDKERLDASNKNNQYLIDLSQRTAEAMEQNFSDYYFDVMRGEFDDLGDYADAMLTSIQRATADVMGQMTKEALFGKESGGGGLIQGIGSWLAEIFHGGGVVGRTPAPSRAVPAALFYDAPRLHRGLAGDEFPAILQKGETVYAKGSGPSIQINVINNGEPVEQSAPAQIRFDGQKYIADVHIDKMINSRSYRQANRQALR